MDVIITPQSMGKYSAVDGDYCAPLNVWEEGQIVEEEFKVVFGAFGWRRNRLVRWFGEFVMRSPIGMLPACFSMSSGVTLRIVPVGRCFLMLSGYWMDLKTWFTECSVVVM